MIDADQEFRELLAGVRAGSEDAAWELVRLYAPQVHSVVSRIFKRRIRTMIDSDDLNQAVWASVFRQQLGAHPSIAFDGAAGEIIGYLRECKRGTRSTTSCAPAAGHKSSSTSGAITLVDRRAG